MLISYHDTISIRDYQCQKQNINIIKIVNIAVLKTHVLMKSMNICIWEIVVSNQLL